MTTMDPCDLWATVGKYVVLQKLETKKQRDTIDIFKPYLGRIVEVQVSSCPGSGQLQIKHLVKFSCSGEEWLDDAAMEEAQNRLTWVNDGQNKVEKNYGGAYKQEVLGQKVMVKYVSKFVGTITKMKISLHPDESLETTHLVEFEDKMVWMNLRLKEKIKRLTWILDVEEEPSRPVQTLTLIGTSVLNIAQPQAIIANQKSKNPLPLAVLPSRRHLSQPTCLKDYFMENDDAPSCFPPDDSNGSAPKKAKTSYDTQFFSENDDHLPAEKTGAIGDCSNFLSGNNYSSLVKNAQRDNRDVFDLMDSVSGVDEENDKGKKRGLKKTMRNDQHNFKPSINSTNWVEEMKEWLLTVPHGPKEEVCSKNNTNQVISKLHKLASGEGLRCPDWPKGVIFCKGFHVDLILYDAKVLLENFKKMEAKHGKDARNGFSGAHPLKKMHLYQTWLKENNI
jgi:hypothetical protein